MKFVSRGYDQVHAGAWDLGARLAVMDDQGIWAQVVYPNTVGFGGQRFIEVDDAGLRLATVQIYNDALAEMQEQSGDRMFGMAVTPWWDVDLALAELHRVRALGLRGVNLGTGPTSTASPTWATPIWDPLWDVCAELKLPVNFHIGASNDTMSWFGSSPWPSHDWDHKLAIGSAIMYLSNAAVMANLIFSGVLERHPDREVRVGRERHRAGSRSSSQSLDYQQQEQSRRAPTAPSSRSRPASTSNARSTAASGSRTGAWPRRCRPWATATSCSRPTTPTPRACSLRASPRWRRPWPPCPRPAGAR